jgi:hypothetical protein
VGTLALGLGANVAIFAVAYAVLPRPLPWHSSSRSLPMRFQLAKFGLSIAGASSPFSAALLTSGARS